MPQMTGGNIVTKADMQHKDVVDTRYWEISNCIYLFFTL